MVERAVTALGREPDLIRVRVARDGEIEVANQMRTVLVGMTLLLRRTEAEALERQGKVCIVGSATGLVRKDAALDRLDVAAGLVVKRASSNRSVSVVASTSKPDREHDVIEASAWKLESFRRNPIVLWMHDTTAPIARAVSIRVEQGKLMADITFPELGASSLSDRAWNLVEAGILKTVSVGFRPITYEPRRDDPRGLRFTSVELLEISLVSIPANVDAQILPPLLEGRAAAGSATPRLEAARRELHLQRHCPRLLERRRDLARLRG